MRDNKTSQAAADYDVNVDKTIPRYHLFHDEILDLVKAAVPRPSAWLDTGCGTGTLIVKAMAEFGSTRFVAADPAPAMLQLAAEKLANSKVSFVLAGSEDLDYTDNFDVITAVMVHHYLDAAGRRQATGNCYRMLKPGGIYITFETIQPDTAAGTQIGLARWRRTQVLNGKSPEAADRHISRYGTELQPVTLAAHRQLLTAAGFSPVEVFWVSGMQAGFYGIK
ncbi:class I SAM-dependent methyltransferase [Sporomusa termitida]|uniref:tRNA (Cmo5U34)-methyltransferase n=1 Tax=Sporomusa termitida TaxID=2377 RepID=A0A517DYQ6_9FIRM|nr:class I SAM-dependent methyltransferase [Sporomusa termitida]QDR82479.1 tRNA (cmo5U34)-methyltransferase [Sporomusa termitida]